MRTGLAPVNAALIAYIDVTRQDLDEKNRLCPPNRQPDTPLDWILCSLIRFDADRRWSKEADVSAWLGRARLNAMRGLSTYRGEPGVQQAMARFASNAGKATANLRAWS